MSTGYSRARRKLLCKVQRRSSQKATSTRNTILEPLRWHHQPTFGPLDMMVPAAARPGAILDFAPCPCSLVRRSGQRARVLDMTILLYSGPVMCSFFPSVSRSYSLSRVTHHSFPTPSLYSHLTILLSQKLFLEVLRSHSFRWITSLSLISPISVELLSYSIALRTSTQ